MRITYFNARLREGGDHALILLISERVKFQSTPPRRRRRFRGEWKHTLMQFSIHASAKEATSRSLCPLGCFGFSIHASAKEATVPTISHAYWIIFSIHASAKEATLSSLLKTVLYQVFQSTPPRRRRRYRGQSAGKAKFFNPRLREGGDNLKTGMWHCFTIFNPRLREGGDP